MSPDRLPPAGDAPPDLRAVLLALSGWAGALAVTGLPGWAWWSVVVVLGATVAVRHRRARQRRRAARSGRMGPDDQPADHRSGVRGSATLLACLVAAGAVAGVTALRAEAHRSSPVAALAGEAAAVTVTGTVRSDPVLRHGRFGDYTLTRLTVREVVGRGRAFATAAPVLVIGQDEWKQVPLGATVRVTGRLGPSAGADLAGVLSTGRPPEVLRRPGSVLGGAERVRAGIRAAVAPAPADARALVPALVVGDDQQMSDQVNEDFRTCGLTHLAAVSGTNLTLVVGFLLILARWAGVRARGLVLVGVLGVAGFVLLARPEPSVLRAAAMGSVALLGLGTRGRNRGVRGLGVAVLVLLLVDPWLALSVGFVLSALATAGILFLGPPMRDALSAWLPRWAAEAVAVPTAAQLACTPVVAAISGQVSLVAVAANLVVAPVVGPATVLGLVGGVLMLVVAPAGLVCGWLAGWCGWWIVAVATRLARLPTAAVDWSPGALPVAALTVLCLLAALVAGPVLRRGRWVVAATLLLVVVMLRPLPSPGWPPRGWVMVACDVGQGDAVVLNAGGGAAVVVDAGPDPPAVDRCLSRLGVERIPVVLLTHFHADHVDGLPAVLEGRRVGQVEVTSVEVPASGATQVRRWAAARRVPVHRPALGTVQRVGELTWQVLGPVRAQVPPGDGGASGTESPGSAESTEGSEGAEGSVANDASLVLLVQVHGVRLLLTGDVEPDAQADLLRAVPGLRADVLKVPHHGSRYQDPALLTGLGARLAVVSVGEDNDYGHPADSTLALLRRAGMTVARTDRQGDVAVVVRDGRLSVRGR